MMENNKTQQNTRKSDKRPVYLDYNIFQGKVRLVQDNGSVIVIERDRAIDMAKSEGKNLMQVGYNKSDFPHSICKIIDYGKFKYEQQKREKEEKRKAKIANAEAKEVVFSIRIDEGDKTTKINHIKKFLTEDDMKVRISIKLSRREMNLLGMAKDLMSEILNNINGLAELDSNPSFNSGIMSCVVRPVRK